MTRITWFIPPASVSHITFSIASSNFPSTSTPPSSIITNRQSFSLPCLRKILPCSPFPLNPRCRIFPHDFPLIQWTSWRPINSIVHSLPPPTPSVSTFAQSSTSILRPSTNLVLGDTVYFNHSPQPYVFLGVTNYFRTNNGRRVYEAEYMLPDATEPLHYLYLIHPSGYQHRRAPSKYAWWFSFKLCLRKLCHCCCCDANDYSPSCMV